MDIEFYDLDAVNKPFEKEFNLSLKKLRAPVHTFVDNTALNLRLNFLHFAPLNIVLASATV